MGLLDFDFEKMQANPMLQIGLGILANNTGNYGRFGPAIGKGFQQGLANVNEYKRQQSLDAYNKRQQDLLNMKYENDVFKANTERKRMEEAKNSERATAKMMLPGFLKTANLGQGFDVGEDGELIPVDPVNMVPVSADMSWMKDADDEYKGAIASALQSGDPMIRRQAVNEMYRYFRDSKKNTKEAKDAIAKERAMAEAMGMDVGDYLRQKMNKSGVNVNVNNIMQDEAAKKLAGKEGYDIGEQAAMIENKYSAVDSIREAKAILQQGIYSGYWGDMGKTIAKASMGAIGDRQKAARTEEFMSYIGNTVVPRLKEFGGNDSNEEMLYLQRIMGGDTSMEPEAIAKILDSAELKIARGIERLQRQRGAIESGRMPDLGPGPSRTIPKPRPVPVAPTVAPAVPAAKVRKYNPATGRIE